MARKFLNGIHISGTTQIDFMPTHESEGILTLGRFDSNTSRYHNIKSYVSSTEASNYLKFSLHAGTENAVVDVLTLNGNKAATFAGSVSIQADDADFLVRSNDYTISRIISRGSSGANLDKGLFSLMSSDGTNNNVEKVRIDTAGNSWFQGGNIGIGNGAPGAILDITGVPWVNPADGTHSGWNFRQGGAFKGWVGYVDSNDVVNLSMDGSITQGINVNASHNVGIGTHQPDSKLDVKGASATPADGNQTLSITNTTGGTQLNIGTVENSYGWIEAREGATLRNLLLNPNGGNVGIGHTTLHQKFTVNGNIDIRGGDGCLLTFNNGDGGIGVHYNNADSLDGRDIAFKTYKQGVGNTEKMRITREGKVGIGQTLPTHTLHVKNSTGDVRGIMIEQAVSASYAELAIKSDLREFRLGTGGDGTNNTRAENVFYIYDATTGGAAGHRFEVGSTGDVKILNGALKISGDDANYVTLTESGSGDFTIDAPDDIRLDAGGGDIVLRAGGTEFSRLKFNNPGLDIQSSQTNSSIYITPNGTGNVYASTDTLIVTSDEGEPAKFLLRADQGDDDGDDWYITNETSNVLTFKNNISGTSTELFGITPSSSASSSIAAFAGTITTNRLSLFTSNTDRATIQAGSSGTTGHLYLNSYTGTTLKQLTWSAANSGFYPQGASGSFDLGLNGNRWNRVYATAFHGDGSNLTGVTVSNADTVDNLHAASFLRSDADDTATGDITFTGVTTIGPGTTGAPYDSTTFLHVKGTTRSIVQQSSTADAYYMFGDAAANNVAWVGYNHSTNQLSLHTSGTTYIDGNTTFAGNILGSATDFKIGANTSDASDNAQLKIMGGGDATDTRGASIHLAGNEHGNAGLLQLRAGDGATGGIRLYEGGSERMRISAGKVFMSNTGSTGTAAGLLHLKGTGDAIRVESTNTGSGGAQIDLLHFTTSPADEDTHAVINMGGYYTGTTSVYGTQIKSIWTDVSDRDARLEFRTVSAGSISTALTLAHDNWAMFGSSIDIAGGQITTPSGTNLALNPNTGTVTIGGVIQASGTGNSTFAGGTTVAGTARFDGDMTLPAAADNFDIGYNLQTTGKIRFGHTSWNNSLGLESFYMVLRTNRNEGVKFIDSDGYTYAQFNASNNSSGAYLSTFAGIVETDKIFVAKGQNVTHSTSAIKISQENTTKSQIRCYGADASTAGTFELVLSANDGVPGYTALAFDNTANATFAGNVQIDGSLTGVGSFVPVGGGTFSGAVTVDDTFTVKNHDTTSSIATQFMNGKRTNGSNGAFGELIFSNNNDSVATVAGFRDGADNKGSLVFQTQDGSNGFGTRLTISAAGAATFAGNILMGNTVVNPASGFADQTGIGLKYSTTVPEIQVSSDDTALQLGRTSTGGDGIIMAMRYASNTIHTFSTNAVSIGTNATFAGDVTLGTGDNLYLNGTTGLRLLHDGSNALFINQTAGDFKIQNSATDKDIVFKGQDGASSITALTLDMSDGGWATFNSGIHVANTFSPSTFGKATFAGNVTVGSTSLAASNSYVLDVKKAYSSGNGHVAYFGAGTNTAAKLNYDTVVVAQDDVTCLAIIEGNAANTHASEQALRLAVGDGSAVISSTSTASNGMYFYTNRATTALGYQINTGTRALHLANNGKATFVGDLEAQGIYVGATNASFDFYNNGTSYFNGSTIIDDVLTMSGTSAQINFPSFRGVRLKDNTTQLAFELPYFTHSTANLAADILLGNVQINGIIELTLTSGYSHQNAVGEARFKWIVGFNADGSIWYTPQLIERRITHQSPQIYVADPAWDSTNARYYIRVYHKNINGNQWEGHVKYTSQGAAQNFISNISVSGLLTSTSTTAAHPVGHYLSDQTGDMNLILESKAAGDPTLTLTSQAANRSGVINFQDQGVQSAQIIYKHNGDTMEFYTGGASSAAHLELKLNETTGATFRTKATFGGDVDVTQGALISRQNLTDAPVLRLVDTGVANYDVLFPDSSTYRLQTNTSSTKNFYIHNAGSGGFTMEVDGRITAHGDLKSSAGKLDVTGVGSFITHGTSWGQNLKLTNTNDDVSPPILTFLKHQASGHSAIANNDYVGFTNYRMKNTNGDEFSWVELSAIAKTVTDGSEDSVYRVGVWGAGTEQANAIYTSADANGVKLGIGTASPDKTMTVYAPTYAGIDIKTASAKLWEAEQWYADEGYQGMYKAGVKKIQFRADGDSYFNSGDFGIGTTNPTSKLHVTGAPANGVYLSYLYNSGTHNSSHGLNVQTAATNIAAYGLRVNTGGDSNALAVMGTGDVGIGTNAPGRKLTITGDTSGDANNLLLSNENDTNGDSASIGFSMLSNNTYVKSGIFFKRTTTQGRGDLIFANNNEVNGNNVSLSDARLTISSGGTSTFSGNVNVGGSVSSPASVGTILGVVGRNGVGGGTAGIVLKDYDNAGWDIWNSGGGLNFRYNNDANIGFGITSSGATTFAGSIDCDTMLSVSYSDISTGENRGLRIINTSGTDQQWNITAGVTGSENESFCIRDSTANVNALTMAISSGNAVFAGTVETTTLRTDVVNNKANSANIIYRSGTTTIVGGGSSSNKLYVLDNGDVGVNDSTPSYKLDADGTIRATGDVIAYSDRRVKENIKTIDNALNKVLKLRGVSYNRKDIDDKSTKIGVIAQEVLETIPEVVEKDLEDKYSVAYGNMAGLFIEAIKELKAEIEELKSNKCNCNK